MLNKQSLIINSILALTLFLSPIYAEELTSPNYKLIDPTISGGSNTASSENYQSLSTLGDFSANPSMYSENYKLDGGTGPLFEANVPLISCFETDTNGTSTCTTGPTYLNENGMVTVCGPTGCFNRARFEIDSQGNPSDTLYSIQISTSSEFLTNIYVLDGASLTIKPITSKNINDYKTKSQWETSTINILGLKSQTTYYIRATAMNGDLTESLPGPYVSATTSINYISFDINLSDENGLSTNSAPYLISLSPIPDVILKSQDLVWLNISTNNINGIDIAETGVNGGVRLDSQNIITSENVDLSATSTGIGLQHFYSTQLYDTVSGTGDLSTTTPEDIITKTYLARTENIANIPIDPSTLTIYDSTGPLYNSRNAFYIATKIDSFITAGLYTETITIIITPKY